MTDHLVTVALPVPLPQLFTYIVPEPLRSSAVPGAAAVVPFGRKVLTGVITGRTTERPDATLKNVIDILAPDTSLSPDAMATVQWMSDYYSAPVGECYRLFLPVALSRTSDTVVDLAAEAPALPDRTEPYRQRQWKQLAAALAAGPMTVAQLQRSTAVKAIHAAVQYFRRAGLLTLSERASSGPEARTEWHLLGSVSDASGAKNERQRAVLDLLAGAGTEGMPAKEAMQRTGASMTVLRTLHKNGLAVLEQRERSRAAGATGTDEQAQRSLTITLNPDQRRAVEAVTAASDEGTPATFLLYGVTGSGKTQVYIESIRHVRAKGGSAIVLVPEISLTPQTVRRFQAHFGNDVVWMHSRMSDGERHDAWRFAKDGTHRIVIGPRSALFAPLPEVKLIIVDEEHEASYKQFDAMPRYHARDAAIVRGQHLSAVVLLGSATPSIESYTNALEGKYRLLELPVRADGAVLPPVEVVNMVEERKRRFAEMKVKAKEIGKKAFEDAARSVSLLLEERIRERLERREGIILLQNRRGFAPFIECTGCGHVERCTRCDVTMTYHAAQKHLRCHYCGSVTAPPTVCPECGGFDFALRGFGTQRVEEELRSLFPAARILRMDLDTTQRKHSHDTMLRAFGDGEADILLGTQMVAKGLDFARVTLVGVISADTQMMLPDFRSAERTFQLLTQVAGRAGRSTLRGEVVIQTSQPEHYALKHARSHDFAGFYAEETAYRRAIGYPPYARIIAVEVRGRKEADVERTAQQFGAALLRSLPREAVLGPAPAVLAKIKDEHRWQIIVKAYKEKDKNGARARNAVARTAEGLRAAAEGNGVRITVDVDAVGTM